ncbi:MAG: hypothetical protein K5785_00785 [Nitrosarchaeum sp.]|nr:hypothetical protein [Nitrosarchaeum sp.]
MVLTKAWLQNQIDTEPNPAVKLALESVMQKYTQAPGATSPKLKEFDPDETYKRVVTYYIDKKGYTPEQANDVARSVVQREKERRGLK